MASAEQIGINKTWELSLYELHRTPQDAITDNTEIAVSPRSLHSELMCPICLDMLKKTMTTKECLHRFCSDCIITALRSGNKECPTCRKKLVSKRSLRHDPNFDLLISKIYPSRDEYEAHQVRVLEKLNKSHSQAALMNSINEGIKLQTQNRLQRTKKNTNENNNSTEQPTQQQPPPSPSLPTSDNSQSASNISTAVSTEQLAPLTPQKVVPPIQPVPNLSTTTTPEPTQPTVVLPPTTHPRDSSDSNSSKFPKRPTSVVTSENESENSSVDASGGQDSATDGEGPSDVNTLDEIELVFMPHPTEMGADNSLMRALKDNAMRYIKTTANATGMPIGIKLFTLY